MKPLLHAQDLHKSFTLHTQGGIRIPVLEGVSLEVFPGDCVALKGASGSGKSTFMRCLVANYRVDHGSIYILHQQNWVELTQTDPSTLLAVRRQTIGYVSQFLRVIPRVSTLDVVAEPLLDLGVEPDNARTQAAELLTRLRLPKPLWNVSPTTFSGGEKQRVNLARSLVVDRRILLLDEPTSALDAINRQIVIDLILERQQQGCALVGIFHDQEVEKKVCNRELLFGGLPS